MSSRTFARPALVAAAAAIVGVGLVGALPGAHAQSGKGTINRQMMPGMGQAGLEPLPNNVLVFPAAVGAEGGASAAPTPSARETEEIVTESLMRYLSKGGVGVVAYSRRLPSVQRALSEGTIKADDANNGPGDSPDKAKILAGLVGASEYLTVSVDNFKYDDKTKTATFSLNVFRNAADGTPLGTSGQNAQGAAPSDVSPRFQQGSAIARAADNVAEKTVQALYPQSATLLNPPKPPQKTRKAKGVTAFLVPIAAGIVYLFTPK